MKEMKEREERRKEREKVSERDKGWKRERGEREKDDSRITAWTLPETELSDLIFQISVLSVSIAAKAKVK